MTYMVSLGTLDSSWPICEYLKFEIIVKKHVKILSWCHSVRDNKEDIPVQCIISSYSKLYFIYYTFSRYDASASNASASSNAYPLDHSNPTDRWCSACIYTPFARPFLLPLDIPNIYQVYCLYLVFSGIGVSTSCLRFKDHHRYRYFIPEASSPLPPRTAVVFDHVNRTPIIVFLTIYTPPAFKDTLGGVHRAYPAPNYRFGHSESVVAAIGRAPHASRRPRSRGVRWSRLELRRPASQATADRQAVRGREEDPSGYPHSWTSIFILYTS
jgi:hypothetical protein